MPVACILLLTIDAHANTVPKILLKLMRWIKITTATTGLEPTSMAPVEVLIHPKLVAFQK